MVRVYAVPCHQMYKCHALGAVGYHKVCTWQLKFEGSFADIFEWSFTRNIGSIQSSQVPKTHHRSKWSIRLDYGHHKWTTTVPNRSWVSPSQQSQPDSPSMRFPFTTHGSTRALDAWPQGKLRKLENEGHVASIQQFWRSETINCLCFNGLNAWLPLQAPGAQSAIWPCVPW